MDLIKHLEKQKKFSEETFGPGPHTARLCDHIRKELEEVEAAPYDVEEWIDIVALALDGAWRTGHTPEEVVEVMAKKLAVCLNRTWPDWRTVDPDKAIEHIRD